MDLETERLILEIANRPRVAPRRSIGYGVRDVLAGLLMLGFVVGSALDPKHGLPVWLGGIVFIIAILTFGRGVGRLVG